MLIAIVNQSSRVSNSDVELMTAAIQIQCDLHAAPAWNQKSPTLRFYSDKSLVPGWAWLVSIIDNDANVPGALGFHSLDNDKVDAFIFCDPVLNNGGVVLYDATKPQNVSIASVLSHEVLEAFLDRYANAWADGPSIAQGNVYAWESADAVEGDSYEIDVSGTKVSVSNFIFPSWFNPSATQQNMPFDYLKKLIAPFTMTTGGYMIVRTAPGTEQQVFAANSTMPEWKKEMKKSEFSRFARRSK